MTYNHSFSRTLSGILEMTALVRFLLNSIRRRSLAGHSLMSASHGRFGRSKSTSCHWPPSRNDRSVGKKWERNWEKRSLTLWKWWTDTNICQKCQHNQKWTMCLIQLWKMSSLICTKFPFRSLTLWAHLSLLQCGDSSKTHWHCNSACTQAIYRMDCNHSFYAH